MGGNVSIGEAMRVLRKAARQRGFEYCEQLADHMDKVANVGVRNVSFVCPSYKVRSYSETLDYNSNYESFLYIK